MRETTSGTNVQRRLLDHQHRRNPCQLFGLVWLLEFPWLLCTLEIQLELGRDRRAGLNLDNASFVAGGCFVDWITFNPVSYASAPQSLWNRLYYNGLVGWFAVGAIRGWWAGCHCRQNCRGRIDPDDVLLFIIANYTMYYHWIHNTVKRTNLFNPQIDFDFFVLI